MDKSKTVFKPAEKEAAVCGLFCTSCSIYIGTKEEPERLQAIADSFGVPVTEMECNGCRSDKRIGYCSDCKMFKCAAEKGIEFCGACEDYPCDEIKQFQAILAHRIELWKNQKRIQEVGAEKWSSEMLEYYACPRCGVINSAYDTACRKCENTPGSKYVEVNHEEILKRMSDIEKFKEELL